jgi:hypothetical protein
MMTEDHDLTYSRKDLRILFAKNIIIALLALTPIVAFFVWVFPWAPTLGYLNEIYYLDHYMNQTEEINGNLLNQWVRHYFVSEVDEDLFRRNVFDKVLVLITLNETENRLYVDYVGQDNGSDIISHHQSTTGFDWRRLGYKIYSWTVYDYGEEGNTLAVFYTRDWPNTILYFVLAIISGGVIYLASYQKIKLKIDIIVRV